MLRVVDGPIDVAAVRDAVSDPGFGAILVFEGVGRNSFGGRPVRGLAYEAWGDVAERELRRIADEVEARWPGARLAVVHRTGEVAIGEPSVVVAVGAPHRDAAYSASRHAIDTLKERLPVWKKELYADGEAWIANKS
jgi:molybdopterin synthase catalytic subunit